MGGDGSQPNADSTIRLLVLYMLVSLDEPVLSVDTYLWVVNKRAMSAAPFAAPLPRSERLWTFTLVSAMVIPFPQQNMPHNRGWPEGGYTLLQINKTLTEVSS